ncbi:hypothetical protein ASE26_25905 [Duganella sp. Root198D2]|nr:hypothetical protein ASE26_25905 [Duganella sp. Root198D2]
MARTGRMSSVLGASFEQAASSKAQAATRGSFFATNTMEFLFSVSGNCRECMFAIIISRLELTDFPFSKKKL